MRTITRIVVCAALCCLAGCAAPAPTDANVDSGGWTWYDYKEVNSRAGDVGVRVSWGSWDKKFVYVLLTDVTTSATTEIVADGPRKEFKVDLKTPNGQKAEVRIVTPDGKGGSLVCDGRSYDLARGRVFILLPRGETFQVQQIPRDVSDVPANVGTANRLLRDDPDVGRVFAKVE